MFVYHNQNPLKREVNDCVVRALSLAENKSWNETYDKLSKLAKTKGTLLDDVSFIEPYLNNKYDKVCYRCRNNIITLNEFIKKHPVGVYLVTMKNHITCVIDGVIYDIWNCGEKQIWTAWKVK